MYVFKATPVILMCNQVGKMYGSEAQHFYLGKMEQM